MAVPKKFSRAKPAPRPPNLFYKSQFVTFLNMKFDLWKRAKNLQYKIAARIQGTEYVPYANRSTQHEESFGRSDTYEDDFLIAQGYILDQLAHLRNESGTPVLFVTAPRRFASHNHNFSTEAPAPPTPRQQQFFRQLDASAIRYLDMTTPFFEDYADQGIPFDFLHEGHLNSHAHQVQGAAIAEFIQTNGFLTRTPTSAQTQQHRPSPLQKSSLGKSLSIESGSVTTPFLDCPREKPEAHGHEDGCHGCENA